MKSMLLAAWHWMFRFETLGQTIGTAMRSALLFVCVGLLTYCTYGQLAPTFYQPTNMATLSGKTQTQCVGRYLLDVPVELGTFGVSVSSFIYGLDENFDTVEVEVKYEDHTPVQFAEATLKRIKELKEKKNDDLHIPLLLAQEVWKTPHGKVLLLRYLKDDVASFSLVNSELHMLIGKRYAVVKGTSAEDDYHNVKPGRESYKFINPKPMEERLQKVAQNIKGYTDANKAPEGFCLAGVVMNNKTMGYDIETADFYGRNEPKWAQGIDFGVNMDGQFPSDGPNLLQRSNEFVTELRKLVVSGGGHVNHLRSGERKISAMPIFEDVVALFYKGNVAFKFAVENALPKTQRSLLRPGFTVSLDFGDHEKPSPVTQEQAIKMWDDMLNSMRLSPANGGNRVDPQTGDLVQEIDLAPGIRIP